MQSEEESDFDHADLDRDSRCGSWLRLTVIQNTSRGMLPYLFVELEFVERKVNYSNVLESINKYGV